MYVLYLEVGVLSVRKGWCCREIQRARRKGVGAKDNMPSQDLASGYHQGVRGHKTICSLPLWELGYIKDGCIYFLWLPLLVKQRTGPTKVFPGKLEVEQQGSKFCRLPLVTSHITTPHTHTHTVCNHIVHSSPFTTHYLIQGYPKMGKPRVPTIWYRGRMVKISKSVWKGKKILFWTSYLQVVSLFSRN